MPKVLCPTCNKDCDFDQTNPFRPFCSEKCKLIDFGKWANEEYQLPETETGSNNHIHNIDDTINKNLD